MKKFYSEPEFELLSLRLLFDVLGPSQPTEPPEEDDVPVEGDDFIEF